LTGFDIAYTGNASGCQNMRPQVRWIFWRVFWWAPSEILTEIAASIKIFDGFNQKFRQKFHHSRKTLPSQF